LKKELFLSEFKEDLDWLEASGSQRPESPGFPKLKKTAGLKKHLIKGDERGGGKFSSFITNLTPEFSCGIIPSEQKIIEHRKNLKRRF